MREFTGQYYDPYGSPLPCLVVYVNSTNGVLGLGTESVTVNTSAIRHVTRDYAKELLDRIRTLQTLYVQPYGPDSILPTLDAFKDAQAFILKLPLTTTGLPSINIASDGEINFAWSTPDAKIDLGFFGDGTYSFYGSGHGKEISGDTISLTSAVPAELIKLAAV